MNDSSRSTWRLTRRGFLVGMGVTGTGLALGIPIGLPFLRRKAMQAVTTGAGMPTPPLQPLLWIEILPDDRVRLLVPKAEMGQGTHTGLAQLAAEELEVAFEKLEVVHASTRQGEDKYRGTAGSMSIAMLYEPMRQAAATMREMLRAEAAVRLKEPPDKLVAHDGAFTVSGEPNRRIGYGALVDKDTRWRVPTRPVALKNPDQFKVIGRPMSRVDGLAKVTGKAIFGHDVRLDGMLYGAVVRPPGHEARMISAQPGKAASMPGVVKVVLEKGFAGVVARTRAQAAEARDAVDVKWEVGHPWQQDELEKLVTVGGPHGVCIRREGDAPSVLERGATLTAAYRTNLNAHASLETQAALAQVGPDGAKVWTSTQFETFAAEQVAEALGLKATQVEVIPTLLGGGFGRKNGDRKVSSAAVEAAILSRAAGAPVHVSWDRGEEMACGYLRPMTHHRLFASLNDGGIEAIHWEQASGDSVLGMMPAQEIVASIAGFDPGALLGAWISYAIPNLETTAWRRGLPVLTGQWRGLGLVPNTFAIETFIDELAHAAKKDPVQFRLDHLGSDRPSQRLAAVVSAAAKRARWGGALPDGHAQGIACCNYHGTMVAEVAEVSLDESAASINVHRVVGAIDCGRAINPNQVKCQVEGCVVMGTSGALLEEITIRDGKVTAANLDDYPLLGMAGAPAITTIILESPDASPSGCGEPPIGPIAPAIGNAFFTLTGKRLREMPMTAERVREALGS